MSAKHAAKGRSTRISQMSWRCKSLPGKGGGGRTRDLRAINQDECGDDDHYKVRGVESVLCRGSPDRGIGPPAPRRGSGLGNLKSRGDKGKGDDDREESRLGEPHRSRNEPQSRNFPPCSCLNRILRLFHPEMTRHTETGDDPLDPEASLN